ncbi:CPBP family intramembrane metalloprotease [Microbulbifer sp. A4B17]|uniref:CPBP family intramembrane glutamic endopeptidase n=1 Tax=Microbulbifer sp. A4B17 TaxID=359370 RepID=UPI000D52CE4A|nr:CPBP family intramembrane glutamic endopeptidase [Microbulbifer sp. A4B17]AWF81945.1 CPBP family intramembrane metalloprotease [Microbulbifer sp. A4B17]
MDAVDQKEGNPPVFLPLIGTQIVCLLLAFLGFYLASPKVLIIGDGVGLQVIIGILGAVFTCGAILLLTRSDTSFGNLLRKQTGVLIPLFSKLSFFQLLLIALVVGICEELLFRGFLQSWLSELSTPFWGVLAATTAFALFHFSSWVYIVVTFGIGLVLGVVYQVFGSLLGVIIWHAIYDAIVLIVLTQYPHWLGITIEE